MSEGQQGAYDRVSERRRAVILAGHFREAEGLFNAQMAHRLGRSAATIEAYFYDPTGRRRGRSRQGRRVPVLQVPQARMDRRWAVKLASAEALEWRNDTGRGRSSYDCLSTRTRPVQG